MALRLGYCTACGNERLRDANPCVHCDHIMDEPLPDAARYQFGIGLVLWLLAWVSLVQPLFAIPLTVASAALFWQARALARGTLQGTKMERAANIGLILVLVTGLYYIFALLANSVFSW